MAVQVQEMTSEPNEIIAMCDQCVLDDVHWLSTTESPAH
jgi:hypothetical protein